MLIAVPLLLLAGLTAACGGSDAEGPDVATVGNGAAASASADPSAPAADDAERKNQFNQCMRDEGIDVVENGPNGGMEFRDNKEKVRQATQKCRQYLPNGGEPPRLSPADIEQMRVYAQCMRENGLPAFPDPDPETGQFSGDSLREAGVKKDKVAEVGEKCRDKLPRVEKGGSK
ncbi:hypothetical protein ACFQ1L_05245 [Phytohabitans flavus]|uniref:hypothetical protein n=1 Tax=Phytohabitans flavus TaxID=1076124 RepID=UPI00362BAEF9